MIVDLSMPINYQLWHARVRFFNNRLNKRNKTIFPLHLSSDLSKRLTCLLSLNFRSAYQLCNFLLILGVLHCLYIQNFLLLKSGDIESNPGPRKRSALKFCHQWKMSFNPDPNKQATEVLFSRKVNSDDHLKLTFNGNQVQRSSSQKHLGLF